MNAQTMIFHSADAASNRRHFAVLVLLISARAVPGAPASLRLHLFSLAEALERFRLFLPHPIGVQSPNYRLALSPLDLPF